MQKHAIKLENIVEETRKFEQASWAELRDLNKFCFVTFCSAFVLNSIPNGNAKHQQPR